MSTLTTNQRDQVKALAVTEGLDAAISACEAMLGDNIAQEVLSRGGFATLQLNTDPHAVPRLRWSESPGVRVSAVRLDWPKHTVLTKQQAT